MKNAILFVILLASCTSKNILQKREMASDKQFTYQHPSSYKLAERIEAVSEWMSECPADSDFPGQISDKPGHCDQGDVMSWAGYTCLSAYHTGNQFIKDKRCLDVSLAQGVDGRWWRGQSRIDAVQTNSLSRDMSLGISSYLVHMGLLSEISSEREKAKEQLRRWIEYIENKGQGKMCNDATDNRCDLFGGAGHIIYTIAKKMGLIEGEFKNYQIIKKNQKQPSQLIWNTELQFTPVGYQLHLKAQELLIRKNLGIVSDKDFIKYAKIFYRKDPANPLHEFLFTGASPKLIKSVLNKCPVKQLNRDDHVLQKVNTGDWAWQRDSLERTWEAANGHDCIFLMNYLIADLEGTFKIPVNNDKSPCEGKSSHLGNFDEMNVCRDSFSISLAECKSENGIPWSVSGDSYCLLTENNYYNAKKIQQVCPSFHKEEGEFKGKLVCRNNLDKKISLDQCMKNRGQVDVQFCFNYKGEWFEKQILSK